mmetsp:Transcript_14700/g.21591  ORF Transcript_14700/g.21591 Transcript_14700/m.21591 type:complete len:107 (+) Transcript_14700:279-599(+)
MCGSEKQKRQRRTERINRGSQQRSKESSDLCKRGDGIASDKTEDVHSAYGLCIRNIATFDMDDEDAVISPPDGVGFDINCGSRCEACSQYHHNLMENDIPNKEEVR